MSVPLTSNTIYINNINEKIKKNSLKRLLNMIFSQYGRVIQIVACKGLKLRGQAWVVFQDASSATNAIRGKNGFNFYGKPLKIHFAKSKSDIISKKEGNYIPKEKRKREEEDDEIEPKLKKLSSSKNILSIMNLPPDITRDMLVMLFQQCNGFQDVRLPPGNKGVAFAEFEDQIQAGMAHRQLNGFQISENYKLNLVFDAN